MKLIRFGDVGNEKPGITSDGKRKDLSAFFKDWDKGFFQNDGIDHLSKTLTDISNNEFY